MSVLSVSIRWCENDEDYDRMITLPKVNDFQITWRGKSEAPAKFIVDGHHLHWFIDPVDEWQDDSDDFPLSLEYDEE